MVEKNKKNIKYGAIIALFTMAIFITGTYYANASYNEGMKYGTFRITETPELGECVVTIAHHIEEEPWFTNSQFCWEETCRETIYFQCDELRELLND